MMKLLIIGLGSMGKRRIRLIRHSYPDIAIVGIDNREDRRIETKELHGIKVYGDLMESISRETPDAAFVCASPVYHYDLIKTCLLNKLHVFTEINLINENHEELIGLAKANNLKLFLSSSLMYRREIRYITDTRAIAQDPANYIYHVGQYLPDWHPWENYQDFFVGRKETNGCREIFCIELPWIINAFGRIKSIHTLKDNLSRLNIDYADNYIVTLEHENGNKGVICVDIVSRKAVRNLEVYNESMYLNWLGTPDTLFRHDTEVSKMEPISTYNDIDKNANYSENIIENMYLDEISNFFGYLEGKEIPLNSFEKDIELLDIVDRIEGK